MEPTYGLVASSVTGAAENEDTTPLPQADCGVAKLRSRWIGLAFGAALVLALCLHFSSSSSLAFGLDRMIQFDASMPLPPPYLLGWSRERWIVCTREPGVCPLTSLDIPRDGCPSGKSSKNLLLTADGFSSPNVRAEFQRILHAASNSHDRNRHIFDKRVLLVLDAAYDAHEVGSQPTSSYEYCEMRKAEMISLGVSAVTCVILDPKARKHLWERGQAEGGHSKTFGDEMLQLDDNYIFQEFTRAIAIFVECGSPSILLRQFKRSLNLNRSLLRSLNVSAPSLKDFVRKRVQDEPDRFIYIGVSTGSSLAGERLFEMYPEDVEKLGGDNSGLGLVPNCSFYPHAGEQDKQLLHRLATKHRTGIMGIPNCQPIVYHGSTNGHLSYICPESEIHV